MSPSVQPLLSVYIDIFRYPMPVRRIVAAGNPESLDKQGTQDKRGKEGKRAGMEEDMEDRQVDGY